MVITHAIRWFLFFPLFSLFFVALQGIKVKLDGEQQPTLPENVSVPLVEQMLGLGYGMVLRFEDLRSKPYAPFASFEQEFVSALGFETTLHLYLGGKQGSRALAPHTDPYDGF